MIQKKLFFLIFVSIQLSHIQASLLSRNLSAISTTARLCMRVRAAQVFCTYDSAVKIRVACVPSVQLKQFTKVIPTLYRSRFNKQYYHKSDTYSKAFPRITASGLLLGLLGATIESDKDYKDSYGDYIKERRKLFYTKLEGKPWGIHAKRYIKELQDEEDELLRESRNLSTVWNVYLHIYAERYAKRSSIDKQLVLSQQSLSCDLAEKIHFLLEDSCLDASLMTIKLTKNDDLMTVVERRFLCIDEKALLLPLNQLHACLMHEIQHVLHDDIIHAETVKGMIDSTRDWQHLKITDELENKYQKFREKRADILACLVGPEYAYGMAQFFLRYIKVEDIGNNELNLTYDVSDSHGSDLERFDRAIKIYKEMCPHGIPPALEDNLKVKFNKESL